MFKFIDHIIEPTRLLMTWQSSDKQQRKRYVVAELNRIGEKITLNYLTDSSDFREAHDKGFVSYPAFQNVNEVHENGVLDAFMRRLPPKTRGDYSQYLEGFRIRPGTEISNFALLGYTGAKLPSDGFGIINPFENVDMPFEFLLEAAGYRYYKTDVNIGDCANFQKEFDSDHGEEVIKIFVDKRLIGYVTRALLPTFKNWMDRGRVKEAWIEKKNGSPEQPVIYLYVKISSTC